MSRSFTASDRSRLIKFASTLPKGSAERKAILAGLNSIKTAMGPHPLGGGAVVYFDLAMQDHFIEEDAESGDEFAMKLMEGDEREALKMEQDALKNLSRMFGTKISNEGHDSHDNLICKFWVDSWAEVEKALDVINKHHEGGDDQIDTGVRYMVAEDFRLYPDGPNGKVFYGESHHPGHEGYWDEWLKDHKE